MFDVEIPTSEMIKEMWNYGKLGPASLARLERSVVRQNASNGHPSGDKYLMSYRTVQIFTCVRAGLYVGRVLRTTNALFCQPLKY